MRGYNIHGKSLDSIKPRKRELKTGKLDTRDLKPPTPHLINTP